MGDFPDLHGPDGRLALVRAYADGLYRWAWARTGGDAGMAEDVSQAVFTRAFECPEGYDPARGEPWGWLLGLAMNELKRLRRKEGRTLSMEAEPAAAGEDPRRVAEVLTTLPPAQQGLLKRHYLEGKPVERMAEEMGITPSAVWARLSQARDAFRRKWEGA